MKKIKLGTLGLIDFGFAVVAFIQGKIVLGMLLLLVGFCAVFIHYATLMRGMGKDPDQGTINGMNGQGKQQSDAVSANMPEPGEQTPDIWEKMTK